MPHILGLGRSLALTPHRCLSLSAPGVQKKKGVSHSCRLDVGPGVWPARAFLPRDTCQTRRTCTAPTIGARGWTAGPRRVRGACKEKKRPHHKLPESRRMSHQTAYPEARPNNHHTTAPTSMRKHSRSLWEIERRKTQTHHCAESKRMGVQPAASERPGGRRENDDVNRSRWKERCVCCWVSVIRQLK